MMVNLLDLLIEEIRQEEYLVAGERVIVGVSGGADSTTLLSLLVSLAQHEMPLNLAVAHLHHGLRPAADDEQAHVATLAQRFGLPFFTRRISLAGQTHSALEERARQERYDFFAEVSRDWNASAVAVGHTADDQAETILAHLLEGAGLRGLAGMARSRPLEPASRVRLLRPLLSFSRAQIIGFLQEQQLRWCEDCSNQDLTFERNRLRHQLLPLLARDFNPAIATALRRLGRICAQTSQFLEQQAQALLTTLLEPPGPALRSLATLLYETEGLLVIAQSQWAAVAPALLPYLASALMGRLSGSSFSLKEYQLCALAALVHDHHHGEVLLPGEIRVRRLEHWIIWEKRPLPPSFPQVLPIPGEILWRPPITLCATVVPAAQASWDSSNPLRAVLSLDSLPGPLTIRAILPGERIHPLGAPGHRKIAKILREARIPPSWRPHLPLVVDAWGRPLWLVGLCIAQEHRLIPQTQRALLLEFRV